MLRLVTHILIFHNRIQYFAYWNWIPNSENYKNLIIGIWFFLFLHAEDPKSTSNRENHLGAHIGHNGSFNLADGKEYLTPSHLNKEIQDEVYVSGGRVSLVELSSMLNVDLSHVERAAHQIVESDR